MGTEPRWKALHLEDKNEMKTCLGDAALGTERVGCGHQRKAEDSTSRRLGNRLVNDISPSRRVIHFTKNTHYWTTITNFLFSTTYDILTTTEQDFKNGVQHAQCSARKSQIPLPRTAF